MPTNDGYDSDDDPFRESVPKDDDDAGSDGIEAGDNGGDGGGPPPGTGQGGGGAGADNPNRRQHKYTTADMKETNKWCRCLQIVLVFLIAIGIMIGISYGMNKLFNSPELVPDAPPAAEAGMEQRFPKNRDYIENLCTPEKVQGSERVFCESACEAYDGCCDLFVTQNGTCYQNEFVGCYGYAKCHGLDGNVDPAPSSLDRICNPRALRVDRTDCENTCELVRCCWDPTVPSCLDNMYEACQDYSHCQNLRPGAVIEVASTNLDMECRRTSPICRRSCNNAKPCTDKYSDAFRDNFISCLSYTPCNTVNNTLITIDIPQLRSRLSPAPSDLRTVCSPRAVEADAAPCEFACQEASCCWSSGANNCFGADPLGCIEYIPCKQLLPPVPIIEVVPQEPEKKFARNRAYVTNLCGEIELQNALDRSECQDICFPTNNCCNPFQTSHSSSEAEVNACYEEEMPGCYTYSRCHALDDYFKPSPDTIHEVCSWEVILQDSSDCTAACDDVRCCWDDSPESNVPPCYDTHYEACQDYAVCQNLRVNASIRVAPPGLEVECTIQDSQICKDSCLHADACCGNPQSSCYRENFIACLSYATCPDEIGGMSTNIGDIHTILPNPSELLAEFCSPSYVYETGIADCEEQCHDARCCFEDEHPEYCFGADPLSCLQYMHCRILYTYTVETQPPTAPGFFRHREQLQNMCSSANFHGETADWGPCVTACAAAPFDECCDPFSSSNNHNNNNNSSTFCFDAAGCYSYSRCHTTTSAHIIIAPSSLDDICSMNSLQIESSSCLQSCSSVQCCWNDEAQLCVDRNFTTCADFSACQNLRTVFGGRGGSETIPVAPSNLDALCTSSDPDKLSDCDSFCEEAYDCCSNVNSTCYRENFVSCFSYSSCNERPTSNSYVSIFTVTKTNSHVPYVDHNTLLSTCVIANENNVSARACEDLCRPAKCCWTTDGSNSNGCFGLDPFGCLQYKICYTIANKASVETQAPTAPDFFRHREQIQNLCSKQNLHGENKDWGPCLTACEAAPYDECCDPFTTETGSSHNASSFCFDSPGCYSYSRCHTTTAMGDVLIPDQNIDRLCSMNSIRIDLTSCLEACSNVQCCWNDEEQSCMDGHFTTCTDYSACQNLRSRVGSSSNGEIIPVAPSNLDSLCTSSDPDKISDCDTSCEVAYGCCSNVNSSCYRDNFVSCLSYSSCNERPAPNNYVGTFQVASTNSHVPYVDHNTMLRTCAPASPESLNATACEDLCRPATCCWTTDGSNNNGCFGLDPFGCLQYKICTQSNELQTAV